MRYRIKLVCILFVLLCIISGCATKEQKACNHEWYVVDTRQASISKATFYTVHCPKCGLTETIDERQWNIYQIDNAYRTGMDAETENAIVTE